MTTNPPASYECPKCGCPEAHPLSVRSRNISRKNDHGERITITRVVTRCECDFCGAHSSQRVDLPTSPVSDDSSS
ncbi:hypothetical protein KOR42_45170 [Thalassoglobus neptunius]|uniref:Uncharacterized protein n=1 Tax=Thalassoglobus neptunius TaxID=1938619 RepID=A0A5C5VY41_9PLAN|nr:hypothetical protein KOR42_45170 [Thalassoglobus neptunius]